MNALKNACANAAASSIRKFVVGKTYKTRYACDSESVILRTVISRTEKSVMLRDEYGKTERRMVKVYDGKETAALGHYSMAPMIDADDAREEKPAAPSPVAAPVSAPAPVVKCGVSLSEFEAHKLRLEFKTQIASLVAKIVTRATEQFEYTLETNIPQGIVSAEDAVESALITGIASAWNTNNGWDCGAAIQLAHDIMEDANCHAECRALMAVAGE